MRCTLKVLKNRLRSKPVLQRLLAALVARYMKFVHRTNRWHIEGEDFPEKYWGNDRPFILCFWHNRLMMAVFSWHSERPIHMLMSGHPDGMIIAQTMKYFNIDWIAGSSRRNARMALRSMLGKLRHGKCVGITPDGPKGPCYEAKGGVAALAQMAGCDVLPVGLSTTRRRILRSWDRFRVALPFGRGSIVWGEPICATDYTKDTEGMRAAVEKSLRAVTSRADVLCGYVEEL